MSLSQDRNNWKTLIFDSVLINPSLAYNETSGIFTAPVSGVYAFWASVHIDFNNYGSRTKYLYVTSGIKILGKGVARTSRSDIHGSISLTTAAHLEEGDEVFFSTDSIANVIEGNGVSSYGGALLHAFF